MEKYPQPQHTISELICWENRQEKEIEIFVHNAWQIFMDAGFVENMVDIKIQKCQVEIAQDIQKEAEENAYAAVILRHRGAKMQEGGATDSVANKLCAKLTFCPLLIIGQNPANKRLLLAIDGSASSMRAIDFVAENIDGANYSVGLIHAAREDNNLNTEDPKLIKPAEGIELPHNSIIELFSDIKKKLMNSGFAEQRIEQKIIPEIYNQAEVIIQEAETGEYDTIVIGRRDVLRVEDFFMGKIFNKIIHADCKLSVWVI